MQEGLADRLLRYKRSFGRGVEKFNEFIYGTPPTLEELMAEKQKLVEIKKALMEKKEILKLRKEIEQEKKEIRKMEAIA